MGSSEKEDLPGQNYTAIKIIETKYDYIKNLLWLAVGISGINFVVLLIMIVQLSNEVFNK